MLVGQSAISEKAEANMFVREVKELACHVCVLKSFNFFKINL
jgi:hypothetical protein